MRVKVNDKRYTVKVVNDEEAMRKGLRGVKKLPESEGMWFEFDEPQTVQFEMDGTEIDLSIVFIDEDLKVISIEDGKAGDEEEYIEEEGVKYVLEVNPTKAIKPGDQVELLDETMHILDENGRSVYKMQGGERVFSIKNTTRLIELARRANESQADEDYKRLGQYMFKCIKDQDGREPEYVEKKA